MSRLPVSVAALTAAAPTKSALSCVTVGVDADASLAARSVVPSCGGDADGSCGDGDGGVAECSESQKAQSAAL